MTWYAAYHDVCEPLTIHETRADGNLSGLLLLAVDRLTGSLACAGVHQAEYQVWLAQPGDQRFIDRALKALCDLGFSTLEFKYIPTDAPLTWLEEGEHQWFRRSILRTVRKPLMGLSDPAHIRESLKKKSNRSRINRLQREGTLEFLHLRDPEDLDRVSDDLILFTDFRQGAVHGSYPFRDDPRKYAFHRTLMRYPDLLHVTVMKVGQKLLSAHIGMLNRRQLSLGMMAHSPFAAEHSPGKIHLFLLARLLSQQGLSALDLTPGDDPYKDRFATHYDEAHHLTIFLQRHAWLRQRASSACIAGGKEVAKLVRVDPRATLAKASAIARTVSRIGVARSAKSALCSVVRSLWTTTEMRFYRMPSNQARQQSSNSAVRESALADLLCYEPVESWQPSKQAFLSAAMSRIEEGSRIYSFSVNGVLAHYGWATVGQRKAHITEVDCDYEYPPMSAVLWDYYTHPSHRGRGLYSSSLRRMLYDVSNIDGVEFIYISVTANNAASRSVIEKTGFQYQQSIIRRKRFGSVHLSRG